MHSESNKCAKGSKLSKEVTSGCPPAAVKEPDIPAGACISSAAPAAASAPAAAPSVANPAKLDRRSLRSQRALRRAFTEELMAGEDLAHVSVASLTERAGLTRRTFYSHYKDIPDFVEQLENGLLDEVRVRIRHIAESTLPELYRNIHALEPASGSVDLLQYLVENRELVGALLGPNGDPAFINKVIDMTRTEVSSRMQDGIFPGALGAFFDYYLTSVVTAEVGIVQRWFETGLKESPQTMARIMTVIAFIRPGDLYGQPIDINVPAYGLKLMGLKFEESGASGPVSAQSTSKTVEEN